MSSLISVKNLSRFYGDICAVNNISFELSAGEILGFLGPNGAGKSTSMNMLSGNLAPSTGGISINGIDLLEQPKQAKTELGYLPETPPLYKEMKVDEYLRYAARLHRIHKKNMQSIISNTKDRCGLSDVGNRLIGNLSKGYQQRVGIAQAILHSPKVIILDEPTVGLDPIQIREIRDLISELGKNHAIILCSHILPEIQAVCDRVQIIHHGELVYTSDIEQLIGQQSTGAIEVSFERPPGIDTLSAMECIDTAVAISNNDYILNCNNTDDLLKVAIEKNWGLYKLLPQSLSLEQIFVNLTSGEIDPTITGDEQARASSDTETGEAA